MSSKQRNKRVKQEVDEPGPGQSEQSKRPRRNTSQTQQPEKHLRKADTKDSAKQSSPPNQTGKKRKGKNSDKASESSPKEAKEGAPALAAQAPTPPDTDKQEENPFHMDGDVSSLRKCDLKPCMSISKSLDALYLVVGHGPACKQVIYHKQAFPTLYACLHGAIQFTHFTPCTPSTCSALQGLLRKLGAGFEDLMAMSMMSGSRFKVGDTPAPFTFCRGLPDSSGDGGWGQWEALYTCVHENLFPM